VKNKNVHKPNAPQHISKQLGGTKDMKKLSTPLLSMRCQTLPACSFGWWLMAGAGLF
jgi:hypothetical protein